MTEEVLREVVATLSEIPAEQVTASTLLTGELAGSLGRARLAAVLRSKHNVTSAEVYRVASFGDLCAALGVTAGASGAVAPVAAAPVAAAQPWAGGAASSPLKVGIDVEPISALPPALDLWDEPFYRETFTSQEIAYAQLRNDPRASLAAMWCAKEALRKADAAFATLDWQRIEVFHDANRQPEMRVDGRAVAGALSLSHTDELAFAVFVAGSGPTAPAAAPPREEIPPRVGLNALPPVVVKSSGGSSVVSWLAVALAVAALAVAALRH